MLLAGFGEIVGDNWEGTVTVPLPTVCVTTGAIEVRDTFVGGALLGVIVTATSSITVSCCRFHTSGFLAIVSINALKWSC